MALIARRSEVWLRTIYCGDIPEARHVINPSHVGDWLADFPISDELRDYTLRTLGQAHECLVNRNPQGACSAILALRGRWGCGPTSTPSIEDYLPSRLRRQAAFDNA